MNQLQKNIVKYGINLFKDNWKVYLKGFFYPKEKLVNHFTDSSGRILQLHGINISNYSKYSYDNISWHTKEDFKRLKDWGFNLVRLEIFWEAIEPSDGVRNFEYIDKIKERVQWLKDLDIYVILDLHQDLYCKSFGGNGFPEWTNPFDNLIGYNPPEPWNLGYFTSWVQEAYSNFWHSDPLVEDYISLLKFIGNEFKNFNNILALDIMNEPFSPEGNFEKNILSKFYNDVEKEFMRSNIHMRLMFEPFLFSSGGIASALLYKFYGDIYSPHCYDPFIHENAGYHWWNKLLLKLAIKIRIYEARKFLSKMIIGEFGVSQKTKNFQKYLEDFVNICNDNLINWCYYSYDKVSDGGFGVLNDDGSEREQLKYLVKPYVQKINGTDVKIKSRNNSYEITFKSSNTSSPNEIYVPENLKVNIMLNGSIEIVNKSGFSLFKKIGNIYYVGNEVGVENQTIKITW